MPEFQAAQQQLSKAREAHDAAERALFETSEQLKRVASALEESGRWLDPHNQQALVQRRELEQQKENLEGLKQERQNALDRVNAQLSDLLPNFWDTWTDPRQHAGQMNDDIPVALFPLRLETRFKTVAARAGQQQQLWVRIYPDECLVDTFEELLSETELYSARIFWREFFHAAGTEEDQRAAWRALVASHGSGRATWIIKNFRPLNRLTPDDPLGDPALELKPQSKAAGDVILVVTVDNTVTGDEKTALTDFWTAMWNADGDSNLESAALNDLKGAVGADRADELVTNFAPYNLTENPAPDFTRGTSAVRVSFLSLPSADDVSAKTRSWMKAAEAELLPERFVLLGYQKDGQGFKEVLSALSAPVQAPFAVSPDPTADPESQFQFDEHGNLIVGDDLRWMLDFNEAVRRGMGFRVNLTPQQAAGFDRLFVLGIRLGSDAAKGKTELESLFQHHYFSRTGFAFLPQGSPTNNTDDGDSAYSRGDDPDSSYDFLFKGKAQFDETDQWLDKRDGQWFAECLGIDTDWLKQVPHAGGVDQSESRAMNVALWPATLGYFMDTLLQPVFNDDAIYYARWFFNHFVSGRGMIPAIRIGRQPYGIFPTSAFSRIQWVFGQEKVSYIDYSRRFQEQRGTAFKDWLWQFKGVLDQLYNRWRTQSDSASRVGMQNGDPHQMLLDIVGLHPDSVEFYQRYANTKTQEHNIAAIWQLFINWQTLPANELHNQAFALLQLLGYAGAETPLLFDLFWKVTANQLNGPVIQDGPLSETDPLRNVTTNDHNYIEWLQEWGVSSFDIVRVQDGFIDNKWPNALLYVLLKHALELGYYDAGVRLLDDAQLLDDQAKRTLRTEPYFFQIPTATTVVATAAAVGTSAEKSRYELLYTPNAQATGDSRTSVVDYLTRGIGTLFATRYLTEQLDALNHLARTPTARLERTFAEHLDCCSYRLDAWMTGLINFQLQSMRYARRGDQEGVEEGVSYRKGIYLGAYGWLENVRPKNKVLTPVGLTGDLDEIFNAQQPEGQNAPLVSDNQNEGYIHAPSVNHAITAAILRNGYISNATPSQPDLLKVNLSSERVRLALGIIEGIRNGQSLAALLGYQFERGLHDRYNFAECDQFIYPLRLLFPLYTQPEDLPEGVSIESIEARNVVNGVNLVRFVKNAAPANQKYPFGFPNTKLPDASSAQKDAINAEIDRLLDLYDAVADLAIAEGVHQVVMGNYDRAAATLDAYGQATFPPIPEVVQTPRSGIALTHRVALHLETGVAINPSDNPRVKAEPAMNRWLNDVLPAATKVSCKVSYTDASTAISKDTFVNLHNLGLQPLDLLYVMAPDNLQARSELEDRVRDVVLRDAGLKVRADLLGQISHIESKPGDFSFFEIAPLVRSLRALLLRSRTLRPTDAALPTDAKTQNAGSVTLDRTRVDFLPGALSNIATTKLTPLQSQLQTDLDAVYADPDNPDPSPLLPNIDKYLATIIEICGDLGRYGLPQTGFGIFYETKAGIFKQLLKKADDVAKRWQDKLNEYDALMATLPGIADEDQRIALLAQAERVVSTTSTDATGKTSAQFETIVNAKADDFRDKKKDFEDFQKSTKTTLLDFLKDFEALLPVTDFDVQDVSDDDEKKRVIVLAEDIQTRVGQLIADLEHRVDTLNDKLNDYDASADAEERLQILTETARSVFGDEFILVPSFTLPANQASEWNNAYMNRATLLDYQKTDLKNDFPVDDWLYGTARVREKMRHVENVLFLTEALDTKAPQLEPVQFPFSADAPWMALEFPPDAKEKLERELLLYTAAYAKNFDGTQAQCGLLLDEWTEVVPGETETTGVTFHFDKPNSEPPQVILLATPTQFTGAWKWDDLVNTLHETLDMARARAVEPQQLDKTELSVFLPATIMATTWQPITIAADLAVVNNFVAKVP
jgi:hypothetical protein